MILNYKKIADINYDKLNNYKDKNQVSIWAKGSVEGIVEKGYMGAGGIYFLFIGIVIKVAIFTLLE
ncbi:hypothetical protein [Romboutsia sp.]|uniref:hypothetical protein n=1 Tax=Romboutsia sp. TaxID=1965302 RepID=UPI002C20C3B8|nr:hypothetical protein [Romboutsia sp.]HSQ89396.1 hypothetical protein [Romboutsia sp.]